MTIVLTKNMKKKLEAIQQESIQDGFSKCQEGIELPKMNLEDIINFHSGEQKDLEATTKKTELENQRATGNHILERNVIVMNSKTSQELIWNLPKNQAFQCLETFYPIFVFGKMKNFNFINN